MKSCTTDSTNFVQLLETNENKDCLVIYNVSFDNLHWILKHNRAVTEMSNRRFFFWSDNMHIIGKYKGFPFDVSPDAWESLTFWLKIQADAICRLSELASFIEKALQIRSKIFVAEKFICRFFAILIIMTVLVWCWVEKCCDELLQVSVSAISLMVWALAILLSYIYFAICTILWHHICKKAFNEN